MQPRCGYDVQCSSYHVLSIAFCRSYQQRYGHIVPVHIIELIVKYLIKRVILAIGENSRGCLGIRARINTAQWTRLKPLEFLLPNTDHFYINHDSISVVTAFHTIYAAGNNMHSRLGIPQKSSLSPLHIKHRPTGQETKFTQILNTQQNAKCSSGVSNSQHTFIYLVDDNKLYANGCNTYGAFGNGSRNDKFHRLLRITPFWQTLHCNMKLTKIACAMYYSLFLLQNGTLYICGSWKEQYKLAPRILESGVRDVSCGFNYHLLLYRTGKVSIDGSIYQCQLSVIGDFFNSNHYTSRYKQISCGYWHGAVLSVYNQCFTFGDNSYGQIGNGQIGKSLSIPYLLPMDEVIIKVECGGHHCLILTAKNDLYVFGRNKYHQCSSVINDRCLTKPYLLDKKNEFGIDRPVFIWDIFAMRNETIIILDCI